MARMVMMDRGFWTGKRVLVTGHTGFKGAWLSLWLSDMGAQVHGLALAPDTEPALFDQLKLAARIDHAAIDLRHEDAVARRIEEVRPEIVFHLAAQPLVRRSYSRPVETWATNVQGTVHVLEALRQTTENNEGSCTIIVSTTDKVYRNREWVHGYRESDRLGGHDPYSASKAATELAIASYRQAFYAGTGLRIGAARAGNVIGGGDWAEDRIVPDIIRGLRAGTPIDVRNPEATRPWQHVLDPLSGYIRFAERLHTGTEVPDAVNFGPDAEANRTVRELLELTFTHWPGAWNDISDRAHVHEAGRLALSIDLARSALDWAPRWRFDTAVGQTIEWYKTVSNGADALATTRAQIAAFEATS